MSAAVSTTRRFNFADFHALTADLTGPERAAVFYELSPSLQQEAWDDLRGRVDAESVALFEEANE